MAPKRTAPMEEIPLASSSSNEEELEDEEISSSEKEDDEAVDSQKPSSTPNKVISSQSDSEDGTDSDDSDSETETETKSISQMTVGTKKPQSKAASSKSKSTERDPESDSEDGTDSDDSEIKNNSKMESITKMTEETTGTKKPQSKAAETATKSKRTELDSEDATDSDDSTSDSERETEIKNNSKIESISKMPEGTKKTQPHQRINTATETATKSKRKEPEPELNRFKRAKTGNVTSNGTTNQSKRLWSEEDELCLLTGMIDFTSKEKISPITDFESFHKFIKNSLQIEVTRSQLTDKMRRMKKKYENNTVKEDSGIVFSARGHDYKIHDLSKKIWGAKISNGVGAGKVVSGDLNTGNKKMAGRKLPMESENDTSLDLTHTDLMKNYNRIDDADLENYVLNEGFSLLEESKRSYFEKKWESLRNLELELFVKRMELVTEQSKNVLEARKAAYN